MNITLKGRLDEIERAFERAEWNAKWIVEETEMPTLLHWESEEQREKAERILTSMMNRIKDTVSGLKQDLEKALKELEETSND